MTELTLLLAHAAPAVGDLFAAAAPPGVRVVPFISPYPGLSSAYDKLAFELRDHDGRLLPGLRRWLATKHGAPFLGPVALCWYSAGYALARALAQHPQDRAEIAGWIAIDGGHAALDPDGTASDSGIAWAVGLAREAADGGPVFAFGHSDVRTAGYASTTQVAAELRRLAGEPTGHWHCQAFNVATADREEHIKAATGWGPGFAARACTEILAALADVTEHTPLPDTVPRPRNLQRGDSGPDVGAWQVRLQKNGFPNTKADEYFGPLTAGATMAFQRACGLPVTGVVDAATRAAAERKSADDVAWIRARNFTDASRGAVDFVVIHSTESGRGKGAARAVAGWFAGSSAPRASAHYVVDNDEVVQCVAEEDVAWAAPGGNRTGIQIELCGRASQTAEEWLRGPMLGRAAALVAGICRRRGIPVERLSPADLLAGRRGITGHVDVSRAFKESTHWDPGPGFPWARFLEMVAS